MFLFSLLVLKLKIRACESSVGLCLLEYTLMNGVLDSHVWLLEAFLGTGPNYCFFVESSHGCGSTRKQGSTFRDWLELGNWSWEGSLSEVDEDCSRK